MAGPSRDTEVEAGGGGHRGAVNENDGASGFPETALALSPKKEVGSVVLGPVFRPNNFCLRHFQSFYMDDMDRRGQPSDKAAAR